MSIIRARQRITTTLLLLSACCAFMPPAAQTAEYAAGYGDDRAMIEDLQARYAFAMDFRDADTYASTFTEGGVLDWANGEVKGRQAIREFIQTQPSRGGFVAKSDSAAARPPAARHSITNVVVRIEGNKAYGRAYWTQLGNDNSERSAILGSYGHYEDELEKIDGQWYFTRRTIYNEQLDRRAGPLQNPAW
ncbi:MAG: nuclear transport factor 2 family protein [Gammaproteobacteria bacterium]|nr:nuclear transport factor 2 family protein [Gammaproteobacteria bacterium]